MALVCACAWVSLGIGTRRCPGIPTNATCEGMICMILMYLRAQAARAGLQLEYKLSLVRTQDVKAWQALFLSLPCEHKK